MKQQFFTALFAVATTVEAANLQAFPSYDIGTIEEIEFAQTYDAEAFTDMLSELAQNDFAPMTMDDYWLDQLT